MKTTIFIFSLMTICIASCKSEEEKRFDRDKKLTTEFITKFYTNADFQDFKFIQSYTVKDSLRFFEEQKKYALSNMAKLDELEHDTQKTKASYYLLSSKKQLLQDIKNRKLVAQKDLDNSNQGIQKYVNMDTTKVLFNLYTAEFLYKNDNSASIQRQEVSIYITPEGTINTNMLKYRLK